MRKGFLKDAQESTRPRQLYNIRKQPIRNLSEQRNKTFSKSIVSKTHGNKFQATGVKILNVQEYSTSSSRPISSCTIANSDDVQAPTKKHSYLKSLSAKQGLRDANSH